MGINVDITQIPDNMSRYFDLGSDKLDCEKADRENSITSAAIVSGMGLLQIIKYADLYGDSVDYRDEVQNKLFSCMEKDHQYWKDTSFKHTIETYRYALDNKVIDDSPPEFHISAINNDELIPIRLATNIGIASSTCDTCDTTCDNDLSIEASGSMLNALNAVARNNERRYEGRVDLKVSMLQGLERSSRNYSAVGRAAMTQSLSIANTLTAISANGLNTGLATLGNGMAKFIGNK